MHRPRYGDWSLPKGKIESGEHPLAGAVREVAEETGVRARPQSRLPRVAYHLPDGTPKTVDYWVMRAVDGDGDGPADPDEVDDVRWLPFRQAAARVSYPHDARLLARVADLPRVTAVLPLVRHGHAGKRGEFDGPDAARPLDDRGRREAEQLAGLLALFDPQRLHSATPLRCRQTLQPLSAQIGAPVVPDPAFDEPAGGETVEDRVAVATARIGELVGGERTVACSQGKLMPSLLASLGGSSDPTAYRTPKGTGWLLCFAGNRLATVDRL